MFGVQVPHHETSQRIEVWMRVTPRSQSSQVTATSGHQQTPQFVEGAGQQQDVVAGEQQRVHLGEFLDGRALGVGHGASQGVQGEVHVVHSLTLARVHSEPQVLARARTERRRL